MGWFWETEEETNDQKGSKKEINIEVVTFEQLWSNYPDPSIVHLDDNNEDIFDDHCAINVSETFLRLDIKMRSFTGVKCYGKCTFPKKHALRAQDLADWLKLIPFPGCPKLQSFTGANFETNIAGKTGIVFFQDYWPRDPKNKAVRTGDHIDLWNKNKLASMGYLRSQLRLTFPEIADDWGLSDLTKSKEVLFWEIK